MLTPLRFNALEEFIESIASEVLICSNCEYPADALVGKSKVCLTCEFAEYDYCPCCAELALNRTTKVCEKCEFGGMCELCGRDVRWGSHGFRVAVDDWVCYPVEENES